ncbi:MAG TPA: hypothetical protein VHY84_25265 [Bryobacteraceae bacterium]|jgi:hypothetical protein|nr:hypothetical protein [Bryobacteraceae bacterium]
MTPTKMVLLITAAAILGAIGNAQTNRSASTAQSGRYQLFSGEVFMGGPKPVEQKVVLRIDTTTGDVDQWLAGQDREGKAVDQWFRTGRVK